jgi:hypothetical protein
VPPPLRRGGFIDCPFSAAPGGRRAIPAPVVVQRLPAQKGWQQCDDLWLQESKELDPQKREDIAS